MLIKSRFEIDAYPQDPLCNKDFHQPNRTTHPSRPLTNPIRQSQRTRRLHAPPNVLNPRPLLPQQPQPIVQLPKILASKDLEARDDALPGEIFDRLDRAPFGHLDLQRTFSKGEALELGDLVLHLGFEDDVVTGDAEIDVTVADKGGNVCGREEHAARAKVSGSEHEFTNWNFFKRKKKA